jgi:hypothetical protein
MNRWKKCVLPRKKERKKRKEEEEEEASCVGIFPWDKVMELLYSYSYYISALY